MKIGRLALFSLLCSITFVTACSLNQKVPQWSGSGFLRKEFLEYRRVAILPFNGDPTDEVSNTFALRFQNKFPKIATLDRKQLMETFQNRELSTDRLDEATRAKLRQVFGIDAEAVKKLLSSTFLPKGRVDFQNFRMRSLRLRVNRHSNKDSG